MSEPTTHTLGSWFAFAQEQLEEADAQTLCEAAFGVNFSELIAGANRTASDFQIVVLRDFIRRRSNGEPVAYIVGSRGFWRHDFFVTRDTLIPRPETETLIETVLPFLSSSARVLDLGTGSGAIGLSIAAETGAHVLMTDVTCSALRVAAKNAVNLNLKVQLRVSNWYEDIKESFDCIVSNPPYVATNDEHLQNGDLLSEPQIALDGGIDGLDALRIVIGEAPTKLRHGGRLVVEHGYDQEDAVYALFEMAGLNHIELVRDLSNHPRVTHGVVS